MSSTPIPTRMNGRIWDSDVNGTPARVTHQCAGLVSGQGVAIREGEGGGRQKKMAIYIIGHTD